MVNAEESGAVCTCQGGAAGQSCQLPRSEFERENEITSKHALSKQESFT